ncbi:MAG: hypothetical protein U0802_05805 [Candidatus Binatia bacterium]
MVTAAGAARLLEPRRAHGAGARGCAGDARLVRLRPLSRLGRPIIGPLRDYANVTAAVGHRAGVLLALITAQLVGELILDRATSLDLQPFRYR